MDLHHKSDVLRTTIGNMSNVICFDDFAFTIHANVTEMGGNGNQKNKSLINRRVVFDVSSLNERPFQKTITSLFLIDLRSANVKLASTRCSSADVSLHRLLPFFTLRLLMPN